MNITIFEYKPCVSIATLIRHHRIARWIIYPGFGASVVMFSSMAQFMIFGFGWATVVIMLTSLIVSAILIVPAICCIPWIGDIEKALTARGAPIPGGVAIDQKVGRWALLSMMWIAIATIVPALIRMVLK